MKTTITRRHILSGLTAILIMLGLILPQSACTPPYRDKYKADAEHAEQVEMTEQPEKTEQTAQKKSTSPDPLEKVITATNTPEEIIQYTGMTVSFNPQYHIPNWVAWELTADETSGPAKRSDKFAQDEKVKGCPDPSAYTNSGYDRGHMAPAGDMKWDEQAMAETFFMTNICPQTHGLNTGSWKSLEDKCRNWARIYGRIIIVTGPVFRNKPTEYLSDSGVAVPKEFFKVILAPDAKQGIGFIMPNGPVPGGMQKAAMSIDEVEAATGHDFFSSLPDDIENEVESQNKFHYWSTLKPERK